MVVGTLSGFETANREFTSWVNSQYIPNVNQKLEPIKKVSRLDLRRKLLGGKM